MCIAFICILSCLFCPIAVDLYPVMRYVHFVLVYILPCLFWQFSFVLFLYSYTQVETGSQMLDCLLSLPDADVDDDGDNEKKK